jgi:prolyl-tRNA synthetase
VLARGNWRKLKRMGMEDKGCKNKKVDIIIYALSNPKKISRGDIKCQCKKCKNKKFIDPDVVMMHASSTKKGSWRNTHVGMHTENHMFLMIA